MGKKKWEEMTPAERRVAICKDVIAQVQSGAMQVMTGFYLEGDLGERDLRKRVAKKDLKEIQENCMVCARGALLLRRVALFNKLTYGQIGLTGLGDFATTCGDTARGLKGAFSEKQLALIECAFEVHFYLGGKNATSDKEAAVRFGQQHLDEEDRLLAIMQNIVDHSGRFVPEVEYVVYE